ncbi:hypothetical protein RFI_10559 [Reticulomyxa filosa]|uniref:Uncharacterized protein n=1 Tax=Reticulomyxa filosa TaxID=46433 RepID=X6NLI5_RETFI|nr:hypothetical protein RFI_10559 [Reticulomyxa filosa]|eukprot:ETO26579.1 hypothetical protein RFI_10559 [Reticulomyxa filosa]
MLQSTPTAWEALTKNENAEGTTSTQKEVSAEEVLRESHPFDPIRRAVRMDDAFVASQKNGYIKRGKMIGFLQGFAVGSGLSFLIYRKFPGFHPTIHLYTTFGLFVAYFFGPFFLLEDDTWRGARAGQRYLDFVRSERISMTPEEWKSKAMEGFTEVAAQNMMKQHKEVDVNLMKKYTRLVVE